MIKIRKKRLLEIFRLIFEAYQNRTGIFATHHAKSAGPQIKYRPANVQEGDANHLYWLALVAFSDRRTNSEWLYKNFARMFGDHPELFIRREYPTVERMGQLFRQYTIALPQGEIDFFLTRKRHLDECFDGNPLAIYENVRNVDELLKKLRSTARTHGIKNIFPGAKEKIFCLLAMFLREFVALDFDDVIPVDVWVQAIAVSTENLRGKGQIKFSTLERMLRPLVTQAFKPFLRVEGAANATWILGKHGCTLCAGRDMCRTCPIYQHCRGPFTRKRHPLSNKHLGVIFLPPDFKPKFKS